MESNAIPSAMEWAVLTYGSVRLGDQRRTQRACKLASDLARKPMGSLPEQMGTPAATKAAYRFFESAQVSYERLMRPHLEQTKELMKQKSRILLIQDRTEVDLCHHPKTSGLSQVGHGKTHQG